ncbi:MarR family transcriptional regulator [Rhodopirellula sp. JC740]|uniref:MarR family transcriptional regulator n=1 Tax=Rhodopirellula halodulae TaxID=2894198 RepID=A0ABS8NJA2_9BACT|nr:MULTISPECIES: MarR family transcriptional regulator [unclassified Rhodopirellula]MCC9643640.1 MarR family transcriptional regulator [Rhodopirellula sp. JC740]MCC9656793.1 MarR family transcriptional regulator [Rhodopirellula sp. JC737]
MTDLSEELHRCQPFASVDQEAVLSLVRTGDQLDNHLSRFFRQHDLTFSQYNLLRILDMEDRPLTCSEIGERLVQVVPAVTALVDRLLKRDLVTRQRSETDRRTVHVAITKEGRKLVQPVIDHLRELEHEVMGELKRKEQKELIRLLELVRTGMNKAVERRTSESLSSSGL